MCVSPNRKLLAVSEKIANEPYPQISIYNIKNAQSKSEKEKSFIHKETKSTVII